MPYQGHHNDGSSVQKHSTGSHYPLVIRTVGAKRVEIIDPSGTVLDTIPIWSDTPNGRMAAYQSAGTRADILAERFNAERAGRQLKRMQLRRLEAFNRELEIDRCLL